MDRAENFLLWQRDMQMQRRAAAERTVGPSRSQHSEPPSLLPAAKLHEKGKVKLMVKGPVGIIKGQQTFPTEDICKYSAAINKECARHQCSRDENVEFDLGPAYGDLLDDYTSWVREGKMPELPAEPFVTDKQRLEFLVRVHSLARLVEDCRLQCRCTDEIVRMAKEGELDSLASDIRRVKVAKGDTQGSAFGRLFADLEKVKFGGTKGSKVLQKALSTVGLKGASKKLEDSKETKQREAMEGLKELCAYHKHDGLFPERECREKARENVVRYPDMPLEDLVVEAGVRHHSDFDPTSPEL